MLTHYRKHNKTTDETHAKKVKQNAFQLDKTRQNVNLEGNPLLEATNITKANK